MDWSYREVIKRLRKERIDAPSESWLYNALALFTDNEELKQYDKDIFHTYGKLTPSHQVKLLTLRNIKSKANFINKIADEKWSVSRLGKEIKDWKNKKGGKTKSEPKKTYHSELNGLKRELKKRLRAIEKLPENDENLQFKDIENKVTQCVDMIEELLQGSKK